MELLLLILWPFIIGFYGLTVFAFYYIIREYNTIYRVRQTSDKDRFTLNQKFLLHGLSLAYLSSLPLGQIIVDELDINFVTNPLFAIGVAVALYIVFYKLVKGEQNRWFFSSIYFVCALMLVFLIWFSGWGWF